MKRYVCGEKKQIVLVVKKKQLNAEYGSFPREVDGSNEAPRWSVATAFPPGRFLNLILAPRGEVYIVNEARH